MKGINNPNYRHGKCCTDNFCVDCGKKITRHHRSVRCCRCRSLIDNPFKGKKHTKETLYIIGKKSKKKFTKKYIEKIHMKHQHLKKKAINGYILIKDYQHPDKNSQNDILEHRLVAEKIVGRRLKKTEIVHHKDGERNNNRRNNLYVCKNMSEHGAVHFSLEKTAYHLYKLGIITFRNGKYQMKTLRRSSVVVGGGT